MAAAELISISGAGLNESPFSIAQTWRQATHEMKTSTDRDAETGGMEQMSRSVTGRGDGVHIALTLSRSETPSMMLMENSAILGDRSFPFLLSAS